MGTFLTQVGVEHYDGLEKYTVSGTSQVRETPLEAHMGRTPQTTERARIRYQRTARDECPRYQHARSVVHRRARSHTGRGPSAISPVRPSSVAGVGSARRLQGSEPFSFTQRYHPP